MRVFNLFRHLQSKVSSTSLISDTALHATSTATDERIELADIFLRTPTGPIDRTEEGLPQIIKEKDCGTNDTTPSLPSNCRDTTFDDVLAHINLKAVLQLATDTRTRMKGRKTLRSTIIKSFRNINICKIESQYMAGSFNIVIPIKFRDGVQWLLRVPANGGSRWDEQSSRALASEVFTMKYIRRKTSVPVPQIYGYDPTAGNSIGCPYILMERIEGISCHHGWSGYDVDSKSIEQFRKRVLDDLAKVMIQLNDLTFTKAGSLFCHDQGDTPFIGACRRVDHYAASPLVNDETKTYLEEGPFIDPRHFFLASLDKKDTSDLQPWHLGQLKALRLWIDWFFRITGERSRKFVLTSPDFNLQNIIVGEDGSLKGLIDWDGVAAVPSCIGCEEYPLFLTEDWDPLWYNPGSEEDVIPGYENNLVMGPDELGRYRAMYARSIEKALSAQGRCSPHYIPATKVSPLARSLYIAANEPMSQPHIIYMIMDKIIELTANDDFEDSGHGSASDRESKCGSDATSETSIDPFTSADEEDMSAATILTSLGRGGDDQELNEGDVDRMLKPINYHHDCGLKVGVNGSTNHHSKTTGQVGDSEEPQHAMHRSSAILVTWGKQALETSVSALLHLLVLPLYMVLLFDWLQSHILSRTNAILLALLSQTSYFLSPLIPILGGLIFAKILDVAVRSQPADAKEGDEGARTIGDYDMIYSSESHPGLFGSHAGAALHLQVLGHGVASEGTYNMAAPSSESPDQSSSNQTTSESLGDARPDPPLDKTASPAPSITLETIKRWHSHRGARSHPLPELKASNEPLHSANEDNALAISSTSAEDDEDHTLNPATAQTDPATKSKDDHDSDDGNSSSPTDPAQDLGDFVPHDVFHALYNGNLDKVRMARMKAGFARLVADLDRRYAGFDAASLRG